MYLAKFQTPQGYWDNLDNVSFDDAIKFLSYQTKVHLDYKQAIIVNRETGKEVFSYRIFK